MSFGLGVQEAVGMAVVVLSALPAAFHANALAEPPAQVNDNAKTSAGRPAPLGSLVNVGGYRVHLYCTGKGSPAVVITGAGGSFDWGLVQPELAKTTRVCAYDRSGTAWSDPGPPDSCQVRVRELHDALKNGGETGPFVLVGHSLGALVSRLYAATYAAEVAGMVIVDHATSFAAPNVSLPVAAPVTPPAALRGMRVPLGEDDFKKLPPREYAMHVWAGSLPGVAEMRRATPAIMPACSADVEARTRDQVRPFGDKPLAVMHTNSGESPGPGSPYAQLQDSLAQLSTNSIKVQADRSSHYMMLDRPDLVVSTVRRVVEVVRGHARLGR